MPITREPSLRNWMKWSSNSNNSSNSSSNVSTPPAKQEPPQIVHLGGTRLGKPLIDIPTLDIPPRPMTATNLDERRLTAWPCPGPQSATSTPPALTRSNTDAGTAFPFPRRGHSDRDASDPSRGPSRGSSRYSDREVTDPSMDSSRASSRASTKGALREAPKPSTKPNPAPLNLRPTPGRSQQTSNTDSFGFMLSPQASGAAEQQAQSDQQKSKPRPQQYGIYQLPPSPDSASFSPLTFHPPGPLRFPSDRAASPVTPASSVASGSRASQLRTPTEFAPSETPSDRPGSRSAAHAKSPSHSGQFPARSSSKGPKSKPVDLRRSKSAVDNNRKYQSGDSSKPAAAQSTELASPVRENLAKKKTLSLWPLVAPVTNPASPIDQSASSPATSSPPRSSVVKVPAKSPARQSQLMMLDWPTVNKNPQTKPLPKPIANPPPPLDLKDFRSGSASSVSPEPAASSTRAARHSAQERLWLHRNYRGEATFLKAWGLSIDSEEDREEGKSILQDLMRAEEKLDEPGLGPQNKTLQHKSSSEWSSSSSTGKTHQHTSSAEWTNSSSGGSVDEAGLHVIQEEESRSPRALVTEKSTSHKRYPSASRRSHGSSLVRAKSASRAHQRSDSETSVLGSYLDTWE